MPSMSVCELLGGTEGAALAQSAPAINFAFESWFAMKDKVRAASRIAEGAFSLYKASNVPQQACVMVIAQGIAQNSASLPEGARNAARVIFIVHLIVELHELAQEVRNSVLQIFMLKNKNYGREGYIGRISHLDGEAHMSRVTVIMLISKEIGLIAITIFRGGMRLWDLSDAISDVPEIRQETIRQAVMVVADSAVKVAKNRQAIGQTIASQWEQYSSLRTRTLSYCRLDETQCERSMASIGTAMVVLGDGA